MYMYLLYCKEVNCINFCLDYFAVVIWILYRKLAVQKHLLGRQSRNPRHQPRKERKSIDLNSSTFMSRPYFKDSLQELLSCPL